MYHACSSAFIPKGDKRQASFTTNCDISTQPIIDAHSSLFNMAVHINEESEVGREDNNQDAINNFEERVLVSAIPRRRGRFVENHERQRVNKLRYYGGGKLPQVGYQHTARDNAILCHTDKLTDDIMEFNHDKLYEKQIKLYSIHIC